VMIFPAASYYFSPWSQKNLVVAVAF